MLAQCFDEWQSYLSQGFEAMRDNGELIAQADPAELALTVISALQGGLLMVGQIIRLVEAEIIRPRDRTVGEFIRVPAAQNPKDEYCGHDRNVENQQIIDQPI